GKCQPDSGDRSVERRWHRRPHGTSTVTINGSVVRRSLSGNYTMNPDGSGSAVLYPTLGPPIHVDLFLSANGLKTNFVVTDSGSTLSGVLTARMLPAPAAPAQ